MPLTIDPGDEAVAAIVARINSAITYTLPTAAAAAVQIVDPYEQISGIRVDVTHEEETQLQETLALEDASSHILRVWVRDKLADGAAATLMSRKLLTRKIFQRINEYVTADKRCSVWDAGKDRNEHPGKQWVVRDGLYVAFIELRVEVRPPA